MKKWTGFFISLAVLILIAYYVMGFIMQSTLNKNINSIPKTPIINVHLDKYQRGFFSSQTILTLKMHVPAQKITDKNGIAKIEPAADLDISIPLTVKHGPIVFNDNGIRFGIGQATTQPETHYGVLVNYFNETVLSYALPSFDIHGTDGSNEGRFQLNWLGVNALLSVSASLDKINGNFNLYGLNGSTGNTRVKIGEVTHTLKLKRHQDWLWLGQSHVNVSSATVSEMSEKLFDLEGFDLKLSSNITEKALNFNCELSLQKLVANNQTYGPGIFKLSVKNLDPVVMATLYQQELNMLENDSDSNLTMLALITEFPKLLAKGPILELSEITLNVPEGQIIGNLKLSIPENAGNDLSQIMQKIHGEGHFKAPIAVIKALMVASIKNNLANKVEPTSPIVPHKSTTNRPSPVTDANDEAPKQADKILQNLASKEFLKVDGTAYVLTFTLENQQFIVNGQPFNPNMLQ